MFMAHPHRWALAFLGSGLSFSGANRCAHRSATTLQHPLASLKGRIFRRPMVQTPRAGPKKDCAQRASRPSRNHAEFGLRGGLQHLSGPRNSASRDPYRCRHGPHRLPLQAAAREAEADGARGAGDHAEVRFGDRADALFQGGREAMTAPIPKTRRATHADIERIMAIRHDVRENRLWDPTSVTAADCAAFIDRAGMWVWVQDGQVQGFSAGDPRDGTIWALFVDPAFEGRGIGRALLSLACGTLRDAGHQIARLNTEAGTRAERFYRTNGWMAVGRSPKGEIIFERNLAKPSE
jgi:GNAT superfamily N-acetyltransferase